VKIESICTPEKERQANVQVSFPSVRNLWSYPPRGLIHDNIVKLFLEGGDPCPRFSLGDCTLQMCLIRLRTELYHRPSNHHEKCALRGFDISSSSCMKLGTGWWTHGVACTNDVVSTVDNMREELEYRATIERSVAVHTFERMPEPTFLPRTSHSQPRQFRSLYLISLWTFDRGYNDGYFRYKRANIRK
jgi:hypothetical protein